jgi:translation initiation factor 2 beta subunit (eIF-2beta)/eIF-5
MDTKEGKKYFCRELKSDGNICAETNPEVFYENRKGICKNCEYLKNKERDKKRKVESKVLEDKNKNALENISVILTSLSKDKEEKISQLENMYHLLLTELSKLKDENILLKEKVELISRCILREK